MQDHIEQNALELLHAIREHHPDIYAGAWYLGLVPATEKSAERDPREKRISKEGEEMLRRLLVGSAHYILGPFGSDSDLRRHGQKIASRGAKNAKKRAVVAVARKLCVCYCTACGSPQSSTSHCAIRIGAKSRRRQLKERDHGAHRRANRR